MSLYDYRVSQKIALQGYPLDALVMAAMRKADAGNLDRLSRAYPHLWAELQERYNAPGGYILPEDAPVKAREAAEWAGQS